ncbi:MAG: DUF1376 domain-containing protein [Hyphomicrobium sp.]|jgi:uncharacterized protein YdaU (DUF1376 family)
MPLYIADYLAGTGHLSTVEHGAYLLLIMHYWSKGGPPASDEIARRITKMDNRQWSKSCNILKSFFSDDWRHRRIDAELAKAVEISKANSANAHKSHENRRRRASGSHGASQVRSHTPSQSHTQDAASTEAASAAAVPGKSLISPEAFALSDRVLLAMGIENGDPMSVGAPMTVQGWLSGGWDPETVVLAVKRVIARGHKARSLGYFERAIADAHAELTRPLPEGSTGPPRRGRQTFAELAIEMEERIRGSEPDAATITIDG